MLQPTRLIVLAAIQQFQPVHGYFLRRELSTWRIDEWANVQPGSIYNALAGLMKDGYISEHATENEGNRPTRVTYTLTDAGEVELLRALREAMWSVEEFDPKPAMIAASFMYRLAREEALSALEFRITAIEAAISANSFQIRDTQQSSSTPDIVREIFELSSARLRGELEWTRGVADRVRAGAYQFADDTASEGVPSASTSSAT